MSETEWRILSSCNFAHIFARKFKFAILIRYFAYLYFLKDAKTSLQCPKGGCPYTNAQKINGVKCIQECFKQEICYFSNKILLW